MCELNSLKTP